MSERVELAGSRRPQRMEKPAGAPDPDAQISVGLYLKDPSEPLCRPGSLDDFAVLAEATTRAQLGRRRQSQYAEAARQAESFAKQYALDVSEVDLAKRRIRLKGTVRQIADAFDTTLVSYLTGRRRYHSHTEPLYVPQALAPWIRGVLGLDTKPRLGSRLRASALDTSGAAIDGGLWPADMARLYGIEAPARGTGQCIAIIAPRGGYLADDLALAAQNIGFAFPEVAEVNVDVGRNKFGNGTMADQEVALDLQVAGAAAPAAKLAIYFTDNSEQGLADAVLAAVHDTKHRPNVISISWGASEAEWASYPQALDVLNGALADSVKLGVVVTAAAGDMLATNGAGDDLVHVNFPASSPYVLSCGGTRIAIAPGGASIASEVVWNDGNRGTGGGGQRRSIRPAGLPAGRERSGFGEYRKGRPWRARRCRRRRVWQWVSDFRQSKTDRSRRNERRCAFMGRLRRPHQCGAWGAASPTPPRALCRRNSVQTDHERQQQGRAARI
jgi:kumamolisin